jgi:nucleotide-binding universal stress UspA family protein
VILGSKGQTNLKYVLLGSTVERLLKEIPCSVLVVRPPAAAAEKAPGGNTGQ